MNAKLPGPDAATLARTASDVLEPVFARLSRIADAVVESRPPRGGWSEAHLAKVQKLLVELVAEDRLAVGYGFAAAPGQIDGQDRYIAWWQRQGERVVRLRLNFDPMSVDVYDYLQMEWFQLARQPRGRVAYGPYVDYSGSELYVVTAAVPIVADGDFLGVAGVDLSVGDLERRLIAVLRGARTEAVLVNAERRVVAANTPRWVIGARLPQMPAPSGSAALSPFVDVAELPLGTGWVLALAESEAPANR
ncbi:cache domain-containing protein [Streptomyces sp. H51]|uniref:cache domain-containing protein n=1 Tax=Streptomyces sp. H51 TaxID=3111770 RepID=UPI002D78102B|nr:cache domain-containing protein [Streptomyces sp. H51]